MIVPISKLCPKCNSTAKIKSQAKFGDKIFYSLECGHVTTNFIGTDYSDWESSSGKRLYPYQIEGARFIEQGNARILIADQPALGKTAQAFSFLKFHESIALPCLWITKSKLKVQVSKELIDWCGIEYFPCIIDTSRSYIMENMKVYVISMDLLKRISTEKIQKIGFKTLIFDEIQHISNPSAQRTQEVKRLSHLCSNIIFLSGTPWKNRAKEYFSGLNILRPDIFPSEKQFDERWVEYHETSDGKWKAGGIRNIKKFRELTSSFVIRRLRDDVLPDLPRIRREINYVEVEDIFAKAYDKAESEFARKVKDQILEGKENLSKLQDDIMILKHIVGLAKVDHLVELVQEWLENSEDWEKLVVFHHHIDVGDQLELKLKPFTSTLRLKGGMDGFDSNRIVEKFKTDIKSRILIASTLASGEGLNLQFCQNAVMMERQWNPANEEQAELRFSRPLTYGDYPKYLQDELFDENHNAKKVSIRVPYLVCANTVDELLTEIVERKRHNFDKSMNAGKEEIKWSENDIMRELTQAIMKKRYGNKVA